uniref:XPG-I domain-containing protein n=1 Tax=Bionectria ochroleuca TaxID=29856 RepID=A0A8H7K4N9_BIOOC
MGIKGIYAQLGQADRVALAKLAAESYRESGRPLRLAIDFAIWQYQTQAAQGGHNPAIRTLFYRLVRLKATTINPVFVFDGPEKPRFKRNKRSGRGNGVATAQAKKLMRLFGFATHDAPGEAEAECALLQKRGIVDAVLSEDVDTIMFGCTKTLRNWSGESKGTTAPTHVTLYDVHDMKLADLGLNREGMVLVALMSGGDYLPDGIPGCGVKVACEAAKAGFGASICRLKASDTEAIQVWREELIHELKTNDSKHFRTKHKALSIPDDFPNLEVLGYYTHPVVSPAAELEKVKKKLAKPGDFHLEELREFTRDEFGWDFRIGALKFIRVLGNALLVHKLQNMQPEAQNLVKKVSGRRTHFSADAEPELRVAYVPAEVVPIDLSAEVDEIISYSRDGLATNSDDEFETPTGAEMTAQAAALNVYDVQKPELAWVLEEFTSRAVPAAVKAWQDDEEAKAARKASKTKKSSKPKRTKSGGMPQGALDKFVQVKKQAPGTVASKKSTPDMEYTPEPVADLEPATRLPPVRDLRQKPSPLSAPSKQPSSTKTSSTADKRKVTRSQLTPTRTPKFKTFPETIDLLSSPIPTEPSARASPTTGSWARPVGHTEVSNPICSGITDNPVSQGVKIPAQATKIKRTKQSQISTALTKTTSLKQSSMTMYTTQQTMTEKGQLKRGNSSGVSVQDATKLASLDGDESWLLENDFPTLASLMAMPPQQLKTTRSPDIQMGSPQSSAMEDTLLDSQSQGTDKPLASVTGATKFWKDLELDDSDWDEFEPQKTSYSCGRGVTLKVARHSNVSVVDLTQED